MAALRAKKLAEEAVEGEKKVEDLFAVKLTNVPAHVTEQDINEVFCKFGKIEQCYIPVSEEGRPRRSKIAIVRFKFKEEASRAVEEQEVTIEFAVVKIERALARTRMDRGDRTDANEAFSQLKRRAT